MKKIFILGIVFGISILAYNFLGHDDAVDIAGADQDKKVKTPPIKKSTVQQEVAVIDPMLKKIESLPADAKAEFLEQNKKESMGYEEFTNKVAEISKQTGWDLIVEKTADGHTHIKNKQEGKDYGKEPLPAFSPEQWERHEETFISLINEADAVELTETDKDTIEKWNQ